MLQKSCDQSQKTPSGDVESRRRRAASSIGETNSTQALSWDHDLLQTDPRCQLPRSTMLGALAKTVGSRARLADVVPIGGRAVGGAAARNSSADDGDSGYSRGSSRGSSDPRVDSDDDDALDHEHDESTEEGSEQEEFRSETHRFVCQLVKSDGFNRLTVGVIVFNTVSIGAETFRALKMTGSFAVIFGALDLTFVTYYTMELALKIYSYPRSFWVSKYNQFDVFVLATSYVQLAQDIFGATLLPLGNVTFLRVLRALRALRALRGISFIRSLQVLVAALRTTVSEVLNLVLLLALLMYIFGIMGYYFFGSAEYAEKGHSTADWDSLSAGCMSLFVFVTADGWTDLQWKLDEDGYTGSKLFTVGFLLVGHFIFINIFIGAETQRFMFRHVLVGSNDHLPRHNETQRRRFCRCRDPQYRAGRAGGGVLAAAEARLLLPREEARRHRRAGP
jgi:hypothetical protein